MEFLAGQLEFEKFFEKFINFVKKTYNVSEISKEFTWEISYDTIIQRSLRMLSSWPEFEESILLPSKKKCNALSDQCRLRGNPLYGKMHLKEALEEYNRSVLYAEHGQCSSQLAFAYANRSAVLFDLGLYDLALQDLDKCLVCDYPKKKNKIILRKIKCMIYADILKWNDTVDKVYNVDISYLENVFSDLIKRKIQECVESNTDVFLEDSEVVTLSDCMKAELLNLILLSDTNLPEGEQSPFIVIKRRLDTISNEKIRKYQIPEYVHKNCVQLKDENVKIKGLSSKVELAYESNVGRFFRATEDIYPGDIIAVDHGYGSHGIVLSDYAHNVCAYCLLHTIAPVPCPRCSAAVFCSSTCLDKATTSFHFHECKLLDTLRALEVGRNAELSLRIVTSTGLKTLRQHLTQLECEQKSCTVSDEISKSNGFDSNGLYDGSNYRTIYHLVDNKESRSVGDLFKRSIIACVLVRLLEKTGTFFDMHSCDQLNNNSVSDRNNIFTNNSDFVFIGSILLRHIANLPCNAHSITRFHLHPENISSSFSHEIGANAYGVLSMCNHSCSPNCSRLSYGHVGVLKAIEFIGAGEAVSDSYCAHFAIQTREERQQLLKKQYMFECICPACSLDWHMYKCQCKRCSQRYCRSSCTARCTATSCVPANVADSVPFRLKCLRNSCCGAINVLTDLCYICKLPYTEDNVIEFRSRALTFSIVKANEESNDKSLASNPANCMFSGKKSLYIIERISQQLDIFEHVAQVIMNNLGLDLAHVDVLQNTVYLLSKYVVKPNKCHLKAQEVLKHCYNRMGPLMLDENIG